MKLVLRDLNFLHDLYLVKYLNSSRATKLFGTYTNCMNRLKILTKNGYIKPIDRTTNGEFVYCVTKKTCTFLELDYKTIYKTDKLNHYLACADFYFSLKDKPIKNFQLEQQFYFSHNGRKYSFRPDIVLLIDRWYLVEIDLTCRRFESKIDTWEKFYTTYAFEKTFDKFPPIIIVTINPSKVQDIIDKNKIIDLNYVYKNYYEIKEWKFKY